MSQSILPGRQMILPTCYLTSTDNINQVIWDSLQTLLRKDKTNIYTFMLRYSARSSLSEMETEKTVKFNLSLEYLD